MGRTKIIIETKIPFSNDPYPFTRLKRQHRGDVIVGPVKDGTPTHVGAPVIIRTDPQLDLEFVVREFLGRIRVLKISQVGRKRDFYRYGARVLERDLERWLVPDLVIRSVERNK